MNPPSLTPKTPHNLFILIALESFIVNPGLNRTSVYHCGKAIKPLTVKGNHRVNDSFLITPS